MRPSGCNHDLRRHGERLGTTRNAGGKGACSTSTRVSRRQHRHDSDGRLLVSPSPRLPVSRLSCITIPLVLAVFVYSLSSRLETIDFLHYPFSCPSPFISPLRYQGRERARRPRPKQLPLCTRWPCRLRHVRPLWQCSSYPRVKRLCSPVSLGEAFGHLTPITPLGFSVWCLASLFATMLLLSSNRFFVYFRLFWQTETSHSPTSSILFPVFSFSISPKGHKFAPSCDTPSWRSS